MLANILRISSKSIPKIPFKPNSFPVPFYQYRSIKNKPFIYSESEEGENKQPQQPTKENLDEYEIEEYKDYIFNYQKLGAKHDQANNYDQAIECYENALELCIAAFGKRNLTVADSHIKLGLSNFYLGNNEVALNNFQQALDIYQKILSNPDDERLALCYQHVGAAHCAEGHYLKGLPQYEKALKIFNKIDPHGNPDTLNLLHQMGIVYDRLHKWEESIQCWSKIIKMNVDFFGHNSPALAEANLNLGIAAFQTKDYKLSAEALGKAIGVYQKKYRGESEEIWKCYQMIGLAHMHQRHYDKGLEALQKGLGLLSKGKEGSTKNLAENYHNIATLFLHRQKYTEALECLNKELEVRANLEDNTIELNHQIAEIYERLENFDKAIEFYRKCVDQGEALAHENRPNKLLNQTCVHLSKMLKKNKKLEDSKIYQEKAQNFLSEGSPAENKDQAPTATATAAAEKSTEQPEDLKTLKKEIETLTKKKSNDNIKLSKLYESVGSVYYKKGKFKEARENFEKALKGGKKAFGEESNECVGYANNLAGAYLGEGKGEEALKVSQKVLGIMVKKLGKDDVKIAVNYINLGKILLGLEEYHQALDYFKQAYELREAKLGEDHAETIEAKGSYEELLQIMKEEGIINEDDDL